MLNFQSNFVALKTHIIDTFLKLIKTYAHYEKLDFMLPITLIRSKNLLDRQEYKIVIAQFYYLKAYWREIEIVRRSKVQIKLV